MIALGVFVAVDIVVGFIVEDFFKMLKFIDGRVTDILVVVDMAVVVVYVANVNIVEAQLLRELLLEYSGKIPDCAIVDGSWL